MDGCALAGLRVLDFSRVLAGPFATMMLADLGADVTKVERPGVGDDTRSWGPPYDGRGETTYFQSVNRNKSSIGLDLKDAADAAEARQLASQADVLVENFRPGSMERFGLGEADLRAGNAGLIYCSITGFGREAGAELPGYDPLVQAMSGLMSITGAPTGEPQKVGVAIVDVLAGAFAATGILAALRHRDATGKGQRVDIDLLTTALAGLVNQASAYTSGGVVPRRLGNRHPSIAPFEMLPTGEDHLVVTVGNDRQFAVFCEQLGLPDLPGDPRFATNADRVKNADELRARLVQALAARSADVWAKILMRVRVPAGVVSDIAGAFDLASRLGLDPIVELPREDGTSVSLTRNPISLSVTPPEYRSAPPPLPPHSG